MLILVFVSFAPILLQQLSNVKIYSATVVIGDLADATALVEEVKKSSGNEKYVHQFSKKRLLEQS